MLKNKNIKKIKFVATFFGLSAIGGIAATVASCAGPSSQTLQSIFTPPSNLDSFTNSSNGSINSVFTNGILENDGYQALLKNKISEILGIWYSKNQDPSFKNKYENFVDDANDDWKSKVTDYQKKYGNDYQVKLQTEILDSLGGTKENWIQDQINQKVLDDFTNQVFAKSFLNYTDSAGNIINNPQPSDIKNIKNWSNIKFTAGNSSTQIDNQVFAQLQDFVFDKWVTIENPNLVSRIVFTNDQPQNGLKEIFNQNVIGSDNLNPSYEYQAFKDNSSDKTDLKGMNAYKTFSKNVLSDYFDPTNDTIDIPNILSSDSGGKLLMTASDMFNSYDVAFTSAFVYQYLRMLGLDTEADSTIDKISNKVKQPGTSTTDLSEYNIMNNFIIHNVSLGTTPSKYSESEYTVPNKEYNNIVEDPAPSGFYKAYANLALKNSYIFNVAEPIASDSTTDSSGLTSSVLDPNNNIFSQFIFTRGKDGVHIIAIDGGKYYLDSTSHERDIEKQENFLKFRAYLASLPNGVPTELNYSFDLNTQLKDWFNAHQVSLIYQFLEGQSADTTGTTIFSNNPDLKSTFDNFKNEFGAYINAFILYNQVLNLQSSIDTMNSKLNAWAQTYSDYLKNPYAPEKIGIAAKLPYVREADGNYFGLLQYYLEILNRIDTTTKTPTPPDTVNPSNILINFNDNLIRGKTRQLLSEEVKSKYQELVGAANNLVKSLDLQPSNRIEYSQNLFIKSNKDSSLYLALNLVINATLTSDPITSSIKMDYLSNSNDFNQIIKPDNTLNDTPVINAKGDKLSPDFLSKAIKNFYQQSVWNGLPDKTIYGNFSDLKDFNEKVDLAWQNQLGASAYSSNRLNYDLLLYTIYYLLKDNLANFKAILSSQIYQGVDALVSWTVPTDPKDKTNNPITNFQANPNYIQGAGWNKQTTTPSSDVWSNDWFNTSITSSSSDSMNPTLFNDSSNFYNYTSVAKADGTYTNLYGFNGISTSNNSSNLDSNVADAMFKNYAASGSEGSLYSFGSKADLLNYIKNINNKNVLDDLVKRLTESNIIIANYYQKDANGKDIYNFAQKKDIVEKEVSLIPDNYFMAFTGFIGENKVAVSSTDTADSFLTSYQKLEPVNESGNTKLTVIAALMKQINYKDVSKLGTGSWWLDSDPGTGRLGLDLSTFLALVVQQAQDSATQSQAISYLIQNNNIGEKGSRILAGDKRIYDALGSQWIS